MLTWLEAQVIRLDKPRFKAWLFCLPAVWLWASYFPSLCFRLLIFNRRNVYYMPGIVIMLLKHQLSKPPNNSIR